MILILCMLDFENREHIKLHRRAHSPTFPSLHLRQSSFSNTYFDLPKSQLTLQPFRWFTYVTAHSPTLLSLLLCHISFSNLSAALPTSQLILQPFRWFTYVIGTSPAPQLFLQPFRRFTYITAHSRPFRCLTYATGTSRSSPGEPPIHSLLQQVTKFRSSYSFGWLLRILLRAVNLFSFSHTVSSDSSFNIHNALYFVKYSSRAAQNSPEGRTRPAGRGLKPLI